MTRQQHSSSFVPKVDQDSMLVDNVEEVVWESVDVCTEMENNTNAHNEVEDMNHRTVRCCIRLWSWRRRIWSRYTLLLLFSCTGSNRIRSVGLVHIVRVIFVVVVVRWRSFLALKYQSDCFCCGSPVLLSSSSSSSNAFVSCTGTIFNLFVRHFVDSSSSF